MKPASFDYHAPTTVAGAVELLGAHEDVKILAGGQSLVPTMNFRLARPAVLVDINRIAGLDGVSTHDGHLEIGALVRHARFEAPVEAGPLGRLLALIAPYVGHYPIRTRGTFAGSLAHADPAAEWAVVAQTLGATVIAQGPSGIREITSQDFFQTLFSTALAEDEMVTAVRLPLLTQAHGVGFSEFARRAGDFALVMALVVCEISDQTIVSARVGLGGVADRPLRVPDAEAVLTGRSVGPEAVAAVAAEAGGAAAGAVTPLGDIHGSPEYRTDLIRAMVRRAAVQALAT